MQVLLVEFNASEREKKGVSNYWPAGAIENTTTYIFLGGNWGDKGTREGGKFIVKQQLYTDSCLINSMIKGK